MKLTIYYGETEPIRATGANQCRLLAFAERFQGWHSLTRDRATIRAAAALKGRGCLEIVGDQFRFTYPRKVAA